MKRLLSIIGVSVVSTTAITSSYFVTSCSKQKKSNHVEHETNILLDTEDNLTVDLNDKSTVNILNLNELENVSVESSNESFVNARVQGYKIIVSALKVSQEPVVLTVKASNSSKPVTIKVTVSPLINTYVNKINSICNIAISALSLVDNAVGDSLSTFGQFIGSNVKALSGFAPTIKQLISKLNLKPEQITPVLNQISSALTLNDYQAMDNQTALDASQIRLSNAFGVITKNYSLTDVNKAPVDWKNHHDKDQLAKSMEVYSKSIVSLIDNNTTDSVYKLPEMDTDSTIYAICQIVGAANQLFNYIGYFDISKAVDSNTIVDFNKISQVRSQKINIEDPIDLNKGFDSIFNITQNKEAIQSLIAILFAINSDKDTGEKALIGTGSDAIGTNLSAADKKCRINGGLSNLIGTTLSAIGQTDKIGTVLVEKAKSILPSSMSAFISPLITKELISDLLANSLMLLINYLGNGINSDNVKLVDVDLFIIHIQYNLTGDKGIAKTIFSDDASKAEKIDTILKDPISFLFNNYLKVDDQTTVGNWSLLKLLGVDEQKILDFFGPRGYNLKILDIKKAIADNLKEIKIKLSVLGELVVALAISIDVKGTSLFAYVINNIQDIGDSKSDFWKFLGLEANGDTYTIKQGSLLEKVFYLAKDKNISNLIKSISGIANALKKLVN